MNKINIVLAVALVSTIAPASAMNRTGRTLVGCVAVGSATSAVLVGSINAIEKKKWQEQREKEMKASECVECKIAWDDEVIATLKAKSFDAWDEEQAALATETRATAKGETSKAKREVREKNQQAVVAENEYEVNSAILLRWELDLTPRETQEMVYNSAPNYYKVILKTPMGNLYPGKYHQHCWLLTEREMNKKQWKNSIVTVLGKANFKEFMDETDPKPHLDCCSKWCVDALKRFNKD